MCRLESKPVYVLLATLLSIGFTALPSPGQGGRSPLLPPNANFRGKSFEEWNILAVERTIATGLGEQILPDTVKDMRLLRISKRLGCTLDLRGRVGLSSAIGRPTYPGVHG